MLYNNVHSKSDEKITISVKDFDAFTAAVMEGRYSWACALMFKSAGQNPLHYIPYRTYNRLLKQEKEIQECKRNQESKETLRERLAKKQKQEEQESSNRPVRKSIVLDKLKTLAENSNKDVNHENKRSLR